jgi:hypothetical protein
MFLMLGLLKRSGTYRASKRCPGIQARPKSGWSALSAKLFNDSHRANQISPSAESFCFKLHAPYLITVEGHVENGVVSNLKVMPAARAKDITIVRTDER